MVDEKNITVRNDDTGMPIGWEIPVKRPNGKVYPEGTQFIINRGQDKKPLIARINKDSKAELIGEDLKTVLENENVNVTIKLPDETGISHPDEARFTLNPLQISRNGKLTLTQKEEVTKGKAKDGSNANGDVIVNAQLQNKDTKDFVEAQAGLEVRIDATSWLKDKNTKNLEKYMGEKEVGKAYILKSGEKYYLKFKFKKANPLDKAEEKRKVYAIIPSDLLPENEVERAESDIKFIEENKAGSDATDKATIPAMWPVTESPSKDLIKEKPKNVFHIRLNKKDDSNYEKNTILNICLNPNNLSDSKKLIIEKASPEFELQYIFGSGEFNAKAKIRELNKRESDWFDLKIVTPTPDKIDIKPTSRSLDPQSFVFQPTLDGATYPEGTLITLNNGQHFYLDAGGFKIFDKKTLGNLLASYFKEAGLSQIENEFKTKGFNYIAFDHYLKDPNTKNLEKSNRNIVPRAFVKVPGKVKSEKDVRVVYSGESALPRNEFVLINAFKYGRMLNSKELIDKITLEVTIPTHKNNLSIGEEHLYLLIPELDEKGIPVKELDENGKPVKFEGKDKIKIKKKIELFEKTGSKGEYRCEFKNGDANYSDIEKLKNIDVEYTYTYYVYGRAPKNDEQFLSDDERIEKGIGIGPIGNDILESKEIVKVILPEQKGNISSQIYKTGTKDSSGEDIETITIQATTPASSHNKNIVKDSEKLLLVYQVGNEEKQKEIPSKNQENASFFLEVDKNDPDFKDIINSKTLKLKLEYESYSNGMSLKEIDEKISKIKRSLAGSPCCVWTAALQHRGIPSQCKRQIFLF